TSTATPDIYTLSLHDALPISLYRKHLGDWEEHLAEPEFWRGVIDIHDAELWDTHQKLKLRLINFIRDRERQRRERLGESPESIRSEEHTSELQSPCNLVCRLL